MQNTFKCALHSVVATRAQVHPLPVLKQRDLTRGKEWEKAPRREIENLDTGMPGMMRLALTSNRKYGSLMCPMYSTDIQLLGTFNQYSYSSHSRISGAYYEYNSWNFQNPGRESSPGPLDWQTSVLPLSYHSAIW